MPVVYTGPVDRYFDYELGDLKWRTVDFKEVRYDEGDHFGCPVMNFSDADVPYTRAIEFKNFNPERHDAQNPNKTVVWEEYSRFAERGDEPYYPVNTDADKALYAQYEAKAAAEPNTVFGGRSGHLQVLRHAPGDRHRPDRLRGTSRAAAEEVDRRFTRGLTI